MKKGISGPTMALLIAFIVLIATGCGAFVSEDTVAKAVEKQGYRDVHIISKHIVFMELVGCGKDDAAAFSATAINPLGKRVDLIICAGWPFKGITVRTE